MRPVRLKSLEIILEEETLLRGYCFEGLKRDWGNPVALVLSSLLFVAPHVIGRNGWVLFFLFVFFFLDSIVFTITYKQGGVLAAALAHAFMNSYLVYRTAYYMPY